MLPRDLRFAKFGSPTLFYGDVIHLPRNPEGITTVVPNVGIAASAGGVPCAHAGARQNPHRQATVLRRTAALIQASYMNDTPRLGGGYAPVTSQPPSRVSRQAGNTTTKWTCRPASAP